MTFFDYPDQNVGPVPKTETEVFLPDASEEDWAALVRYCRRRRFDAGQAVISVGATQRSLYLIVDGTLDVLVPTGGRAEKYKLVGTLGDGNIFGEMSFFDSGERSALVRANTPTELLELGPESFDALAEQYPRLALQVLWDLGRILTQRLRQAQDPAGPGRANKR